MGHSRVRKAKEIKGFRGGVADYAVQTISADGFAGPFLTFAMEMAKVFEGQLDADVVFACHLQHGVDAAGFLVVIETATGVFNVEEIVAHPDADEVAAVGGEVFHPAVHAGQGFGFIVAPGSDHVQADRDVRAAVGKFEVAGVAGADTYKRARPIRAKIGGLGFGNEGS